MENNSHAALTPVTKNNQNFFLPLMPEYFKMCWQKPDYIVIGGLVNGVASATLIMRMERDKGEIQWLFTASKARRQGLCYAMISHIITQMPRAGMKSLELTFCHDENRETFEGVLQKLHFKIHSQIVPYYKISLSKLAAAPVMHMPEALHNHSEKIVPIHQISSSQMERFCYRCLANHIRVHDMLQKKTLDPMLSMVWLEQNEVMGLFLISRPEKQEIYIDLLYQLEPNPRAMLYMILHCAREFKKLPQEDGILTVFILNEQVRELMKRFLNMQEEEKYCFYNGHYDLSEREAAK